jgi:hypothetical protein
VRSTPPPPDFDDAGVAVTVTDCDAEPPGPVQLNISVSVALTATDKVPLVICGPVQPVPPLAEHVVAFCELQVSVTLLPATTEAALALKVTVGAVDATCTAYRPYPEESGVATKVKTYSPGVASYENDPPP